LIEFVGFMEFYFEREKPNELEKRKNPFYHTLQMSPLRYVPSGKFREVGWSHDWLRKRMICASRRASRAASATIFWKRRDGISPEQEKVKRRPLCLSS